MRSLAARGLLFHVLLIGAAGVRQADDEDVADEITVAGPGDPDDAYKDDLQKMIKSVPPVQMAPPRNKMEQRMQNMELMLKAMVDKLYPDCADKPNKAVCHFGEFGKCEWAPTDKGKKGKKGKKDKESAAFIEETVPFFETINTLFRGGTIAKPEKFPSDGKCVAGPGRPGGKGKGKGLLEAKGKKTKKTEEKRDAKEPATDDDVDDLPANE